MAQTTPRVWLITGSSSGFGRAMVEEVLRNGEIAIATLRKPSALDDLTAQYPRSKLLVLPLDVTNETQVKSAFVQAKNAFGHVDVVYNNAAQTFFQEIEGTPIDRARALMDTNFWGAVTVSLEAVKFFREENPKGAGGMLVQVSSVGALKGYPMVGFYCTTKAALSSFTEVLAQEVPPAWNIRLVDVHPGATVTDTHKSTRRSELLEAPAEYASEPTAVTTQIRLIRGQTGAISIGDATRSKVEDVTKRIWSVTRMNITDISKDVHRGIPGLVNMYTGADALKIMHAKIGTLQDELVWNTKVHYKL